MSATPRIDLMRSPSVRSWVSFRPNSPPATASASTSNSPQLPAPPIGRSTKRNYIRSTHLTSSLGCYSESINADVSPSFEPSFPKIEITSELEKTEGVDCSSPNSFIFTLKPPLESSALPPATGYICLGEPTSPISLAGLSTPDQSSPFEASFCPMSPSRTNDVEGMDPMDVFFGVKSVEEAKAFRSGYLGLGIECGVKGGWRGVPDLSPLLDSYHTPTMSVHEVFGHEGGDRDKFGGDETSRGDPSGLGIAAEGDEIVKKKKKGVRYRVKRLFFS